MSDRWFRKVKEIWGQTLIISSTDPTGHHAHKSGGQSIFFISQMCKNNTEKVILWNLTQPSLTLTLVLSTSALNCDVVFPEGTAAHEK